MGKKLLFFLAWLGIFCIGIFNIVYLILPGFISKYIVISSFMLETAILILSVVYVLLAVYKLLSKFERNKDYEVSTPNGTIVIASSTINKYVVEVLQRNFSAEGIKVKSYNKRKGILLDVKMNMTLQGMVGDEIQKVQEKIKEEMQEKLGIQISKIKVRLSNMSVQEKQEEKQEPEQNANPETRENEVK